MIAETLIEFCISDKFHTTLNKLCDLQKTSEYAFRGAMERTFFPGKTKNLLKEAKKKKYHKLKKLSALCEKLESNFCGKPFNSRYRNRLAKEKEILYKNNENELHVTF